MNNSVMKISNVHCLVADWHPEKDETLFDDIDIEKLRKDTGAKYIDIYNRDLYPDSHEITQWIIDFRNDDGVVLCVKYPGDIEEDEIKRFVQPVIDYFKRMRMN